jgi:ElaB/YqjD/DUF883 family membrane-anchored ribosome-binding protein
MRLRVGALPADRMWRREVVNRVSAYQHYFMELKQMATESGSSGFASGNAPNLGDKLSAAAAEGKARAGEMGRKAADSADQVRSAAAAGLGSAANAAEGVAKEGGKRARRAAAATANAISSGADYIRDTSAQDMVDDARDVVKNNPGVALLGAIALGFIVGRLFASRS